MVRIRKRSPEQYPAEKEAPAAIVASTTIPDASPVGQSSQPNPTRLPLFEALSTTMSIASPSTVMLVNAAEDPPESKPKATNRRAPADTAVVVVNEWVDCVPLWSAVPPPTRPRR